MNYGFIKSACLSPDVALADCKENASRIIAALKEADHQGVQLAVFPELCITGYTCGDLFFQRTLLTEALDALLTIARATTELSLIAVVGLPLDVCGKVYNVAAPVANGRVLGLVPKTYLPNFAEFYEKRWFQRAPAGGKVTELVLDETGDRVPFGTDLLFSCEELPHFVLGVEICEDLWSANPPSTRLCMSGATVIANPSASDETVGKAEYRRELIGNQSARLLCAYLYASAGYGESTQDMTFAGHCLIAEDGELLAERKPFETFACVTEIDVDKLTLERNKNTTFEPTEPASARSIGFHLPVTENTLTRVIPTAPFVPSNETLRAERCELIFHIQSRGLATRLDVIHAKTAVIGISGGLDSCLALLVAVRAMEQLGRPASDVLAVTMPCFGTTKRTRSNAEILCERLGVSFQEVNITDTVRSHFKDIGQSEEDYDVTFENGQARVRTLELMDIANKNGGIVVGTGDLSELALGWATYNGDHMSMYGVNAGVPKTLVRHMVRYAADTCGDEKLSEVLIDILETPVSPELLPATDDGEISQQTEKLVGPYELHDFYLYYVLRFGFSPKKIFHLAKHAFADRDEYTDEVLLRWLRNFYWRFFAQQFKRSCLPDGPKVGSVTLSPRGDWRMPTDASVRLWMDEVQELEESIL